MNLQLLLNGLLALALVAFISFRQLRWRPINVARMWRMPLILLVIGLITIANQVKGERVTGLDIGVLAVELVIALGVGAAMGRLAQFRPLSRTGDPNQPEFESRTGWVGMVLWIVMIGIRIGVDVWALRNGALVAASTGVILIVLAANRAARTAVFAARVARLDALAASTR